ncbi:RagB/SusD family nutrient uptake outer membrane protein [Sphingobacterium wenxiniae]|uniref:SusD family protein n=1 Tax=Sphingobacterium wenxiniae TaxID=683125 RepID=A0A1I6PHY1_9SPHI|nr:RagB/SusD family nutrient uptake outer membrane protein [Sphingobacterium wenxiniae]SFS39796.1 SusD family protein [Sphingobacterium wenxiniae]
MRLLIFIIPILFFACSDAYLNIKSDQSITTPSKLSDYRAMMDNSLSFFNNGGAYSLSMCSSDEFYLMTPQWQAINDQVQRNVYIFATDIFGEVQSSQDWNENYQRIMVCNMVIEHLEKYDKKAEEVNEWNEIFGSALFFRAFNYYQLAQVFCPPYVYNDNRTHRFLGLPLRLAYDVTLSVERSDLHMTYQQIIKDLNESIDLLPNKTINNLRPSRQAAYALLARIHLLIGDFAEAKQLAELTLGISDDVYDFSQLNTSNRYSFPTDYGESNSEIIFFASTGSILAHSRVRMHVDEELYKLYENDDLRKIVYYDNGTIDNIYFRGSLFGNSPVFIGLTIGEMLLIRAECNAREGLYDDVSRDLSKLRRMRFTNGGEVSIADFGEDPILFVLQERRRELAFRGLRWEDLRRLNRENKYAKTIEREIQGISYKLLPNDSRYTFPLPNDVVSLGGYPQNNRD